MRRLLFVLLVFVYAMSAWAQMRGTIPREYVNRPASDLEYKGQPILPEEAHDLYIQSRKRLDLSTLNPVQDTDIWKDAFPARLDEKQLDDLPVEELDEVKYDSNVLSRSGNYRFNVTKVNAFGVPEIFTVLVSKNSHSMLLTKALLRKIGYNVPAMKWLAQMRIKFDDEGEKKRFINYLEREALAGDADNWIAEDFGDNTLLLQDVVVMEGMPLIYNLAMGPITNDLIQGRRLLSSLVVPLALTNVPESVNMFRWSVGNIADNLVSLQLDYADEFDCSWEDARWIGRRIEKLSRADWEDVVASSHVPKPVQMVMLEKLIGRRNNLVKLLDLDALELKVDPNTNYGAEVVSGKVVKEKWDGYATRFAYGDPDSPLSDAEMTSWIKSKALQTAIDGAVSYVNSLPQLGSDIQKLNSAEYDNYIKDYINSGANGGDPLHMPVKGWVFPTFRANLVLTRNITTGTYLGTDSMVNLVDAIGINMDAGVFAGMGGIPSPFNVSARASASVTRVYAHLRPVTTLSKALKYPFKNMLVPMVKREYGKNLNEILNLNLDELTDEERQEKLKKGLAPFKEDLQIGESLIVTDTILVGGSVRVGASYMTLVKANLGVAPSQVVLSRFHIHRRSEDIIQIYRDFGNVRSIAVNFSLDSWLPIIKLGFKTSAGSARTKFFSLNINPEQKDAAAQVAALRDALLHSSLKKVEKLQKPWVVEHKFSETEKKMGIFFWRWNKINSFTDMDIQHPKGDHRQFFRAYAGQNKGKDYQEFALESVRNWLSLFLKFDFNSTNSTSNPGFSFKGSAKNKVLTYEGETTGSQTVVQPFMRLSRIWNGWEVDQKKAQEILEEIRNRYGFQFYEQTVLNDTIKIFLYTISVNVLVYDKGVEQMAALDEDEVRRIFSRHAMRADLRQRPLNEEADETASRAFLKARRKWLKARDEGDTKEASSQAMKALTEAEDKLNLEGLRALLGGEGNFYVTSKIDGYRTGDEDGDRAIISNSFGEYGRREIAGPLQSIVQQSEMLEGEFFIYWIMTRLI
ncbi:MAG: hypothetical protein K2P81_03360 [Bacteriovoracaceae bacterium]|nr:hypothetical protein [Bacteriovoracaceae bacterium]